MSDEDTKAELERLRRENAALKKGASDGIRMKVSEKGAVSVPSGANDGWAEENFLMGFGYLDFRSCANHSVATSAPKMMPAPIRANARMSRREKPKI